MKIYINWEFTMHDKVQKGQTKSYKGGINPDIFESFKVEIDRTNRLMYFKLFRIVFMGHDVVMNILL